METLLNFSNKYRYTYRFVSWTIFCSCRIQELNSARSSEFRSRFWILEFLHNRVDIEQLDPLHILNSCIIQALSILDNYINLIQLCKIQPDLYITRMHTTNKKTKRERYDKKSCRSKLQHATSHSSLHSQSNN